MTDAASIEPVLELSTQVAPARVFTVDGEDFHLLGFEHLDADGEAKVTAGFARHERLADLLGKTKDPTKAQSVAKKLRASRVNLITLLTDVPEAKVAELPMPAQGKLLRALQKEVYDEDEEGESGADEDGPDPDLA